MNNSRSGAPQTGQNKPEVYPLQGETVMPLTLHSRSMKGKAVAVLVLVVLGTLSLTACSKKKPGPAIKPAGPVTAKAVVRKTVPVQVTAIGNVEAYSTVSVKAQVGGQLSRVHFREGQDVKKGELLFTIDTRPFEAQIRQAEANLARSTAQMENAREDARRYAELVKKGYVAREQYEQYRTAAVALEATVRADKALLENAPLQLSYCYIHAPVAGKTGSLIVNEGNLVKSNADTPLVVINQIQPVYVTSSVPERDLPEIKKYMAVGKLKVGAFITVEDPDPEKGLLTFIDNAVDAATGTIRLKATF